MARLYLDSSALVKAYVDEAGSARLRDVLSADPPPEIYIAHITPVEVVAALARRSRGANATAIRAAAALNVFREAIELDIYNTILLTSDVMNRALHLAMTHYLRGYDAIQLAAAFECRGSAVSHEESPLVFVSADVDLNRAAVAEGFLVEDPTAPRSVL